MWKFLESEMKVIIGLSEDANRTDSEVADLYDLRKGTVASIRRRLLDAGAIHFVNVPSFNKLGCEMLGFHIGTADPSEEADARTNDYVEFCNRSPQIFEGILGGNSIAFYTVFRNATEYDTFVQSHNRFFSGSRRSSKAKLRSAVFPFALSRGTFVPNFASIIHNYFSLDIPAPRVQSPGPVEIESPDLSDSERATLIAMVENPMASDREIASIIKLSRQAVTRIRNRMIEDKMVSRACLPRLYKWGFEICAIAHAWFNMEMSWDKRLKSQPRAVVDLSFYTLSKPDEAVASYLIASFANYSERVETTLAWYHKVGAFDEKPEITLFPLERGIELRSFDYGPAVRELLTRS